MAEQTAKKEKKAKGKNIFSRIAKYFRDLGSEMKKVVWPSKKQTINNTIVVLVVCAVAGIVLVLLDLAFGGILKGLLSLL